jgi:hypothetical protein
LDGLRRTASDGSGVNKDSGHKAKDSGHKTKDKDLGGKAKAKDLLKCPWSRPKTLNKWQGQGLGMQKLCKKIFKSLFQEMDACFCTMVGAWPL